MTLEKYLAVRPKMKSGDLLEWRSNGFIGKAIRFFTKKEVNHSGLVLSLDSYLDVPGNHKFTLEALEHGIELNLLSRSLVNHSGSAWWYPLKPEYDSLRSKIAGWAVSQVGIGYDYKSLWKNMFGKVSADARRFFCSEYVAMSYQAAGLLQGLSLAPRPGEITSLGLHGPGVQVL